MKGKLKEGFQQKFATTPEVIVSAPGRINIIGEHTDYNLGYVMPAAIAHHIYIAMAPNNTNEVNVYSADYNETAGFALNNITRTNNDWLNLIKGVASQFNGQLKGFNMLFCGDIPVGAGLSSSAALCCGTGLALSRLFHLNLDKWQIAKAAQLSEHTFGMVQCGIMDQFASVFGQKNHVLMLDCQSLDYEAIKIDLTGHRFILLDSGVKHQLNDSEYNTRSDECVEAMNKLQQTGMAIQNFRELTSSGLTKLETNQIKSEIWYKRAMHIVSENERVLQMAAALKENNMTQVGNILSAGHRSLRDNFEVTCEETDFLAEQLSKHEIVLGARQVGGGFGGCILALVRDDGINEMIAQTQENYMQHFNIMPRNIPIEITDGCRVIG